MTTFELNSSSESPANRLLRETDSAISYMICGTSGGSFPELFVKYDIDLSPDAANWEDAVYDLATSMAGEYAPWLVPAISKCCAWKIIVAIAKEQGLIPGLRTPSEHDRKHGGAAKYRNYPGLLYSTRKKLSDILETDVKADIVLENLNDVEPGLFDWLKSVQEEIPGTLVDLAMGLYRIERNDPAVKTKLNELAHHLLPLRQKLIEFKTKLPDARNIKRNIASINALPAGELTAILMDEDGYLRERIRNQLEKVQDDEQQKRALAISVKLIKRGLGRVKDVALKESILMDEFRCQASEM